MLLRGRGPRGGYLGRPRSRFLAGVAGAGMPRSVRLWAVLICGVVALLVVGVASAFAWEQMSKAEEEYWEKFGVHISRHPESFKSGPQGLRWCKNSECFFEPEITLPAGEYDYVYNEESIPVADNHECEITEEGKGKETCKGSPVVLPGFTFVSYKLHDSYELGSVITREIGWAYRPYEGEEERKSEQFGPNNPARQDGVAVLSVNL